MKMRFYSTVLGLVALLLVPPARAQWLGWGGIGQPPVQQDQNDQAHDTGEEKTGGDPVSLWSGKLQYAETLMSLPGRAQDLPFRVEYESSTAVSRHPGVNWVTNFDQFVVLTYGKVSAQRYQGPQDVLGEGASAGSSDSGGFQYTGGAKMSPRGVYHYRGHRIEGSYENAGKNGAGLVVWTTPPTGACNKLRSDGFTSTYPTPNYFQLREKDGSILTFGQRDNHSPFVYGSVYWLTEIQDRMGNAVRLEYEPAGVVPKQYSRLRLVRDNFDRPAYQFLYDSVTGLLSEVQDLVGGRSVKFVQTNGDLTEIIRPEVIGTSTQNDFFLSTGGQDTRKKHRFTYDASHQMLTATQGREILNGASTPYLVNTYLNGNVVRQVLGGASQANGGSSTIQSGGTHLFFYEGIPNGVPGSETWTTSLGDFQIKRKTLHIDPNGNAELTCFDQEGHDSLSYRFTGRLVPENVTATSLSELILVDPANAGDTSKQQLNPAAAGYVGRLRGAADPWSYLAQKIVNQDGLPIRMEDGGSIRVYTYYTGSDEFQRGNVLRIDRNSISSGTPSQISEAWVYEPISNQVRAYIEPRGLEGATPTPGKFMLLNLFDYQEGAAPSASLQALIDMWAIDMSSTPSFGIPLTAMSASFFNADKNGDGKKNQEFANLVLRWDPKAYVYADPENPSGPPTTQQQIKTQYVYEDHGQSYSTLSTVTDPEGNVTEHHYFPASSPSGPGNAATSKTDGGLHWKTVYSPGLPESVTSEVARDLLGRETKRKDGRGNETQFEWNALDQVVSTTSPSPKSYVTRFFYDGNDCLTEVRRDFREPFFNNYPGDEYPTGAESPTRWISDKFEYDILNRRVTEYRQFGSSAVEFTTRKLRYDKAGNLVFEGSPVFVQNTIAGASHHVRSRILDERNRPWKETAGGMDASFASLSANENIVNEFGAISSGYPTGDAELGTWSASTQTLDYDVAGNIVRMVDAEGNVLTREYDGFNRLVKKIAPSPTSHYQTLAYDAAGHLLEELVSDAGGATLSQSVFRYDEMGRNYQIDRLFKDSSGSSAGVREGNLTPNDGFASAVFLFDANGRIVQEVDDNQVSRFFDYDTLGRLATVSDEAGNVTQNGYDRNGNCIESLEVESGTDAQGNPVPQRRIRRIFDELDRCVAEIDSAISEGKNQTNRFVYDSLNRLVFQSDAKSALTSSVVWKDSSGASQAISTNDHGNSVRMIHDDLGRLRFIKKFLRLNGLGKSAGYVSGNSLLQEERQYDLNSRLYQQTDDKLNVTTNIYDTQGRHVRTLFADGSKETKRYLKNGALDAFFDPNGTQTSCSYGFVNFDGSLGVTLKSVSPGASASYLGATQETFAYDALGRMKSYSENQQGLQFLRFFDTLSHVCKERTFGGGWPTRESIGIYDGLGNLAEIRYPGGRIVTREHDSLNRLQEISDTTQSIVQFGYEGVGRLSTKQFGNGRDLEVLYDGYRRPIQRTHAVTATGVSFDDRSIDWDAASNKRTRIDYDSSGALRRQFDYAYDSIGQMTQSVRTNPNLTTSYTLDGDGNRTMAGYVMSGAVHPKLNEYTNTPFDASTFGRTYDKNGSLSTLKQTASTSAVAIKYDYRNLMTEYHDISANRKHQYLYDPLGRRIQKVTDVGTGSQKASRFYYLGERLLEEQNSSGASVATFVWGRGADEILQMKHASAGTFYYHADDIGNVMKTTDASGNVTAYEYGDFGQPLDDQSLLPITSSSSPFFFNGKYFDFETGLYHYRTRYMDPKIGRFTTRDSIGIWGDANNLGNGYSYCGNNPWSRIDPMGTDTATIFGSFGLGMSGISPALSQFIIQCLFPVTAPPGGATGFPVDPSDPGAPGDPGVQGCLSDTSGPPNATSPLPQPEVPGKDEPGKGGEPAGPGDPPQGPPAPPSEPPQGPPAPPDAPGGQPPAGPPQGPPAHPGPVGPQGPGNPPGNGDMANLLQTMQMMQQQLSNQQSQINQLTNTVNQLQAENSSLKKATESMYDLFPGVPQVKAWSEYAVEQSSDWDAGWVTDGSMIQWAMNASHGVFSWPWNAYSHASD